MTKASRVVDIGARTSTLLENRNVRVLINDQGGMIPEFSVKMNAGYLNTHWIPTYRSNSAEPYDKQKHGAFWNSRLDYHICGNFPCAPSFGPQHYDGDIWFPTHGWAANDLWDYRSSGIDDTTGASYAISTMVSPEPKYPLKMKKIDLVLEDQPIHYSSIRMYNEGDTPLEMNFGYHNTIGSPFLQKGCVISLCADRFATPPLGGEFDKTGRIKVDAEFESLKSAPMRDGTTADISIVPNMCGYTDFVAGRIPSELKTGWSSVVNPDLGLAYICFFNGAQRATDEEIVLAFNDLWLQFGGRNFVPFAPFDGAPDSTYCLATENAIGAYATGLKNAKLTERVMGLPTTFIVEPHKSKVIYYATALLKYERGVLDKGVENILAEQLLLKVTGASDNVVIAADTEFSALKSIECVN